jgi:hypothetical protein
MARRNNQATARGSVLKKGTSPRDLLKRPSKVIALIKAQEDFYNASCRVDYSDGEKRYKKADKALQKELKGSTEAERKAAENALANPPWRKK